MLDKTSSENASNLDWRPPRAEYAALEGATSAAECEVPGQAGGY